MKNLIIYKRPNVKAVRMIIGFSGWMDGGEVSTGTIQYLKEELKAKKFAEINPGEFYILSFPGTMEQVAQFRPYTKIKDGLLVDFRYPKNEFFVSETEKIVLFLGKEPNLRWDEYANCIFQLGGEFGVSEIYFVGSVAGPIPHTREPAIVCSVLSKEQKTRLGQHGVRFTNYEGPASIVTLLNRLSKGRGIEMTNLVAEVPAYVQAKNPKAIEAIAKRLVRLLDLDINLDGLHRVSLEFEKNIDGFVAKQPALSEEIKKLEENYDREAFGAERDFEDWLKQQGIDKL